MHLKRFVRTALIVTLAVAFGAIPLTGRAQEPITIDAIVSLTGALAFVGKEAASGLAVAQDAINKAGGVDGRPVKFVIHDDQTNPQVAVQLVDQVLARNAPVFLGPTFVAACNAVAPLIKEHHSVMYCISAAFHPPAHSYGYYIGVSTTDQLIFAARYARARGLKKFASITSIDANGQDADRGLATVMQMPENKDLTLVDSEHFGLSDITVDAQMARIKASGAQVIYTGNNGTPLGVILHGYTDVGLDVPIITSSGALNIETVTQYAAILPKEFLIAGILADGPAAVPNGPEKTAVDRYLTAFKAAKLEPDHARNLLWDAAWIVVDAMRKYGPNATAEQINDYIENLHGWAGSQGRYDFRNGNQSGLNANDLVMVRWNAARKTWDAVSRPGGGTL